jgi:hypothetical protein
MDRPPNEAGGYAGLHRRVAFGQSNGQILWQPRIGCWYTDKQFAGEPLPPPFTGMGMVEIYRELGCSARIYEYNACYRAVEPPTLHRSSRWLNDTDQEFTLTTPVGRQSCVLRKVTSNWHHITLKWWVTTEEELRVATWRAENTAWEWDAAAFEQTRATWGDLGAPTMFMPRVNIQDLYINTMGVENAVYALGDWPDSVVAYFRALDESHDRLIEVINASPVEIINFGDNLHAGTLSPALFRRYVLPAYQHRCARLHAAGKFVCSHWDGDTKTLLPFAQETGLDGIEAITPRPQGDVTLEEIRAALGDRMVLLDGIPAVYFDAEYPVSTLEACARRLIELFAPRLILGISDEISSHGEIERIRVVGRIVAEYNAARSAPGGREGDGS